MTTNSAIRHLGRSVLYAAALALMAGTAMAQAPKTGGTLVYLDQQAHTNLYPPAGGFYPNGGILGQVTDKLTYQNPETLAIEPWIAESWDINADSTEYVFHLRDGVTFSDGTPLDAAAVARNFDTFGLGDKERAHTKSEVFNNYSGSEVLDPLTVKFTFNAPSPGFLQGTSVIGSGIVSPETLDHNFNDLGDATRIVGSGPFVVESETLGSEINLKAREDYNWAPPSLEHQGRAYLDGIKIIVTFEDGVRIGALLSEQADFIRQVQAYDEPQITRAGFELYAPSTRGVNNSIVFRPDNPLVADLKVRQALLHATNSADIISTLFSANYPQATSIIPTSSGGYVDLSDKLNFDPALAAQLLDEAGWTLGANGVRQKDGQRLELAVYESLNYAQSRSTLQLVSQQWKDVGVVLNVLAGDTGSRAVDSLDPLKTPVAHALVGRADADVIKSQYYPTTRNVLLQAGGSSDKVQNFVDAELNGLLDAIASEADATKRLELVGDVQAYIVNQAYTIPLLEEPQVFAGSPHVQGVAFESVGRPNFYSTWLDK